MAALLSLQCLFGLAEYRNDTRYACFYLHDSNRREIEAVDAIDRP
jgi:hypothetical protein